MSNHHHHPHAETLIAYAAGQLSFTESLMIRLHCQVCDVCAKVVRECEQVGGQLLEQASATALQDDAFSKLMGAIEQPAAANITPVLEAPETSQPSIETIAPAIEDIFTHGASTNSLNWQWRTKRFAEIPLPVNDANYEAKLIYIKKGMKIPRHTHKGQEFTLVLTGAFSDDSGQYKRGDYICKTQRHEHAPVAESDCICLAITTAPLKFTGTLGPVLNWMYNN